MSWRAFPTDGWAEAKHLGVEPIVRRMNWSRRRLTIELNRSGSADFFVKRVTKLAQELDQPRLMHRDPAKPPTTNPALAAKGEGELVPEEYEAELVKQNRTKDNERNSQRNAERKKNSLVWRLAIAEREAQAKAIPIDTQLGAIARQLDRIESRLDKVA